MAIDPREFDDLREIDSEVLEKMRVSWFTRTLLRVAVPWGLGRLAKELQGPGIEMSQRAHALFAKTERVDVIPLRTDLRGFRVILDSTLALYFIQAGDHFVYDGFELGPYCDDGDVTVFDGVR
jgi:hypothetical protein